MGVFPLRSPIPRADPWRRVAPASSAARADGDTQPAIVVAVPVDAGV